MFHTYVMTGSGNVVDFDRASFLMDRDLLKQALDAMRHERDTAPNPEVTYDAQWVWGYYCQLHYETYGEFFVCDDDPNWDRADPVPHPPIDLGPNPKRFIRVLGAPPKRPRRRRAG